MTPALDIPLPSGQLLPFCESLLAVPDFAFVSMLEALDQTIVGTALPRIAAYLFPDPRLWLGWLAFVTF
jgi:hypothetical protein